MNGKLKNYLDPLMLLMTRSLLMLFLLITTLRSHAQSGTPGRHQISLSGGRVLFGTGDVPGYGIGIDVSRRLLKHPKPA